jgi:hypothetical protein
MRSHLDQELPLSRDRHNSHEGLDNPVDPVDLGCRWVQSALEFPLGPARPSFPRQAPLVDLERLYCQMHQELLADPGNPVRQRRPLHLAPLAGHMGPEDPVDPQRPRPRLVPSGLHSQSGP